MFHEFSIRIAMVLALILIPSQVVLAESPELTEARSLLAAKKCNIRNSETGAAILLSSTHGLKLNDADMPLIARFTTHEKLDLGQNNITDNGFRFLKTISDLRHLDANATRIGDASVQLMSGWPNLRVLSLSQSITDEGIRALPLFMELQEFRCASPFLTDECTKVLAKFPKLRLVSLGPNVTPAGYERLASMPNIENISVNSSMDDSIMAVLAKFPRLRHLSLDVTQVTEAGLPHLRRLENIRYLTLPMVTTDRGLQHVAHMRNLEQLDLRHTQVTNAGLVALKDVTSLHSINLPPTTGDGSLLVFIEHKLRIGNLMLYGRGYTDASIPHLLAMPGLQNIVLHDTALTPAGIARLKSARGNLRVH